MPVYALGERTPLIDPTAYVHPDAVVIGAVRLGGQANVWPAAVLRGDYGEITVGAATSVQDGAVLHATADAATRVGDRCVIGHLAHLEGCTVGDRCLVGSGAVVLAGAVLEDGALVGAGALVPPGFRVPAGRAALGVPARLRPAAPRPPDTDAAVDRYRANAERYRALLRRLD